MKILKYLFFLLLIVFIGGAIYFATKDGNYQIEQSKIIDAPVSVVFNKVNDYKTWENWGPWKKEDPTMVFNYPEKTKGEGASYSWNGKDVDGSMRTTSVIPDNSIKQDITFQTPAGERKADVYWNFEEVEGGTKVTWGMKGEHPLMDKAYFAVTGTDFDADMREMYKSGLESLSQSVEKDLKVYSVSVDGITQHGGGFYMYTSASTSLEALDARMAELLPKVHRFMEENNITMAGKPMTIYNEWDEQNGTAIISCAIPTTTRIITPSESAVLCSFMPSQTVVKATLKGDYKNLKEAWDKAQAYVQDNGYEQPLDSAPFELYVTDPEETPNPADWITEIYIPIKAIETP